MLMGSGGSLTLGDWKTPAWPHLVTSAMSKSTYGRILEDLSTLKDGVESKLLEQVCNQRGMGFAIWVA